MVSPCWAVLIVAGLHVPVMLLPDVVGNAGAMERRHNGPIWINVGVMEALTVTLSVAVVPLCPAEDVKVYVVVPGVAVENTGLQVPMIPFLEVVGSGVAVAF